MQNQGYHDARDFIQKSKIMLPSCTIIHLLCQLIYKQHRGQLRASLHSFPHTMANLIPRYS
jgi:hypothetical protein